MEQYVWSSMLPWSSMYASAGTLLVAVKPPCVPKCGPLGAGVWCFQYTCWSTMQKCGAFSSCAEMCCSSVVLSVHVLQCEFLSVLESLPVCAAPLKLGLITRTACSALHEGKTGKGPKGTRRKTCTHSCWLALL
eukprot:549267-Pelagomonas_calceolata.AAC.1